MESVRCEDAAAAVSSTTNLKDSLASLRWESEKLHVLSSDYGCCSQRIRSSSVFGTNTSSTRHCNGPVPLKFGSVSIPENCAHAVPNNMTSEHCNQLSSCKVREGLAAVVQFILYQWFQIAQLDVSQAAIAQNHSPPIPVSAKAQMPALLSSQNRSLALLP